MLALAQASRLAPLEASATMSAHVKPVRPQRGAAGGLYVGAGTGAGNVEVCAAGRLDSEASAGGIAFHDKLGGVLRAVQGAKRLLRIGEKITDVRDPLFGLFMPVPVMLPVDAHDRKALGGAPGPDVAMDGRQQFIMAMMPGKGHAA